VPLEGVHLLLTYRCEHECDHCFVWSGPDAEGTMTLGLIRDLLEAARRMGTVHMVYFEGGEPFLFYSLLVEGMRLAAEAGFDTGIVTNGYWAIGPEEAEVTLRPLRSLRLVDLSVSSDLFHGEEDETPEWRRARAVAEVLGVPAGAISIAQPSCEAPQEGGLRFRGRAAEKLIADLPLQPWDTFTRCSHEELADPGRVHIDPFGNVHLCQGLLVGNIHERPLDVLFAAYDPATHPIVGPLLEGGPAELVRCYNLSHEEGYVEDCHLCYRARAALRERFPDLLGPGQVYGEKETPAMGSIMRDP
jgi:MoaA/NifB/PqqE/SkfB family radical SAM enzyme